MNGATLRRMSLIQELERTRDETLKCFSLDQRDLARTYGRASGPSRMPCITSPIARPCSSIASVECSVSRGRSYG